MASFQFSTHEDIVKSTGICALKAPRNTTFQRRNNSSATWSVVFAPDRSRFAWSSGNRIVHILPWDELRNCPIVDQDCITFYNNNNNEVTGSPQNGDAEPPVASDDQRENNNNTVNNAMNIEAEQERGLIPTSVKPKTIDCGDMVMSLAFGSSSPNKKMRHSNIRYRMYDYLDNTSDLMVAMGLKSGKIKTYNITKDVMLHLMDHKEPVRDLSFSPDGSLTLVSGSCDNTLKVWDLKDDGNMVKTLRGHNKPVIACSFSPNGQMMASVGYNKVAIVWEMTKYTVVNRLVGHYHDIVGCQFSPDGALLATASYDSRVCVWDPYTGECLQELHHVFPPLATVFAGGANNHFVRDVAFSPDGSHIATVCDDKYVRFWSLFDTSDPQTVFPLENALTCVYSPNGNILAAGTRRGEVKFVLAPMKISKLQHLCRQTIRRCVQDTNQLRKFDGALPSGIMRYLAYRDIANNQPEEESMGS